jgi:hypothetical protein
VRPLFAIVPVALFVALATSVCIRSGVQLDDAGYVALRVADNLRTGHGIVFNPGERRDLVDSPLWLAALAVATVSPEAPLLVLVAGMLLGIAVLLVCLTAPRLIVAGACASLFLGLDGAFASSVVGGGSTLLAALYLVVFDRRLRAARGRDGVEPPHAVRWLALWAAAAPLVRYELVAVSVLATLGWALTDWQRRKAWLPLAGAVGGAILCAVVRAAYFGGLPAYWEPWPPTAATVAAGGRSLGEFALRRPLLGIGVLVMLAAWARGGFRLGRTFGIPCGLAALAGLSLLPAAGGDVERSAVAMLPLAYVLSVQAVWRGTRTRLGLVAALLLVIAQPARTWTTRAVRPESRAAYAKLGQWLATHALPGTVVGARHVGALGYYSGLEVEDVLGQVSPRVAVARRTRQASARAGRDIAPMLRQEPDLVLTGVSDPVPSSVLYVPNLDAVPPALRGDYRVYRWAGSPVWRREVAAAGATASERGPHTPGSR